MTRVHIMVEGQTEETFVRDVLYQHFIELGIFLNPFLFSTSKGHKGGVVSYEQIKRQVRRKCREDRNAYVTTMIDLYALPTNFPLYDDTVQWDWRERVMALEKAFGEDIAEPNFLPNLLVHEFEGLLFSDPDAFESQFLNERAISLLRQIANDHDSPEDINDGRETAPSKRILKLFKDYQKPLHGPLIAAEIGIGRIQEQCRHFRSWIDRLAELGQNR